jgi:glycosyltransferase involved in cell wall biosynthesis
MNSPVRPHILILPRWYPNRYDPMPGLFVQHQAEALALECDVTVLYVHADPDCPNAMETEFGMENRVQVIRVYYRPPSTPAGRWLRFYSAHFAGLAMTGGTPPDIVHVHVLTREGFMGYLFARRFRIPFVISEHWSRYYPENDFFHGFLKKAITRFVVSRSSAILPVSRKLMTAMVTKGLKHPNYRVVPNVLDMERFRFFPSSGSGGLKTIVHVSCFEDRSKNITGLLDAVNRLRTMRSDFTLRLVGEGPDLEKIMAYASQLALPDHLVVFPGLKEGNELVTEYGTADFSVLSSRFETFGSVIIESLSCGTPVLATNTGIAAEVINETNGEIVNPDDLAEMTAGLDRMLDKCRSYDRNAVRRSVEGKFSAGRITALLLEIYNSVSK